MADKPKAQSILRSTAVLGMSSVGTILIGLVTSKAWAVLTGPAGVGFLGLMQGLLTTLTLVASLGVGTALVRKGALALAQGDELHFAALRKGAWLIFWVMAALVLTILFLFRHSITRTALGSHGQEADIVVIGVALVFTLAVAVQNGLLNAHHRVNALAASNVISSVLAASVSLSLAWRYGIGGIGPSILTGAVIVWAVSRFFLWRELRTSIQVARQKAQSAALDLARFGAPYTLSTFFGAGVQNLIPFFINARLGQDNVGYYRASSVIAVNYLAFLLNSMAQDYYPRISAVSDKPSEMVSLVNQQFRLSMLLGAPMVMAFLALAPFIIPIINTAKFAPAAEILEWQLIGDLFKLTAWSMGFVILARSSARMYFFTEAIGGLMMMGMTWVAMDWMGLQGIGFAFLATSCLHCLAVWIVVRREIDFRWTVENLRLLAAVLMMAGAIRILPYVGLVHVRTPVSLIMTVLLASYSASQLWRETRSSKPKPELA